MVWVTTVPKPSHVSDEMPSKRSSGAVDGAQARKKQKVFDARHIAVESSLQGLPSSIDVERFVSSRAFEIKAMADAIKRSKDPMGRRAWQSLPRHLRRRAASHNPRRVPSRLRQKARFEMKDDKSTKPSRKIRIKMTRKQFKKYKGVAKIIVLKRRAKGRWLETHMWHAKRAKMVDAFGLKLAMTPTDKCFRSAYRATKHGCFVHDASYFKSLTLSGRLVNIKGILDQTCEPNFRFPKSGSFDLLLYEYGSWPNNLIGLAHCVWIHDSTIDEDVDDVTLMIRVVNGLTDALCQQFKKAEHVDVQVFDCLNSFELFGPRSTEILSKLLLEFETHDDPKNDQTRRMLVEGIQPSAFGQAPPLRGHIRDPRIFKPKDEDIKSVQTKKIELSLEFVDRMNTCPPMRYRQCDIDARRQKYHATNQSSVLETSDDDRVGVMCYPIRFGGTGRGALQNSIGWTLIISQHWSLVLWRRLCKLCVRWTGLRERRHLMLECNLPSHPTDFLPLLSSPSHCGEVIWKIEKSEERKPKSKRISFRKLDRQWNQVGNWFSTLSHQSNLYVTSSIESVKNDTVWMLCGQTLRDFLRATQTLFNNNVLLDTSTDSMLPLESLNQLLQLLTSHLPLLNRHYTSNIFNAFVSVLVKPLRRGMIEDGSVLYDIVDDDWFQFQREPPLNLEGWAYTNVRRIIGFVTTGNYSLKSGKSKAIALVPIAHVFKYMARDYYNITLSGKLTFSPPLDSTLF